MYLYYEVCEINYQGTTFWPGRWVAQHVSIIQPQLQKGVTVPSHCNVAH
jgi:hypothetical protein